MAKTFNSISPSAKALLLAKSLTNIPFAKEAASLAWSENELKSYLSKENMTASFIMRLIHFEHRHASITNAIQQINLPNIFEFSSGFSFRGLSMCANPNIQYTDTDLPVVIKPKRELIQQLMNVYCDYSASNLHTIPLNVLDTKAFNEAADKNGDKPIMYANEGLMMYFDSEQKKILCNIIHGLLKRKGGYWATADIYIKKDVLPQEPTNEADMRTNAFLKMHNVEENKFENFQQAETFFRDQNFAIHQRVKIDYTQLSSMAYVRPEYLPKLKTAQEKGAIRETWILKAV